MDDKVTLEFHANPSLLAVLSVLKIPWRYEPSRNGDGDWVLIDMTNEADQRLHDAWERMTDLRFLYMDSCQQAHGIQLSLPMMGGGNGDG